MLSSLQDKRETGFTLIELLTVIIIIGILAAIAIPVFSAQRSRAQDSQTVSDVRNIVTAAETYLSDRTKTPGDIADKSVIEYASAKNVQWEIKGNNTTNGYCIVAFNASGKDYNSTSKLLSYDSTAGGLKSANGSCGPKDANGNVVAGTSRTDAGFTSVSTPAAATFASTAVGSAVVYPATTFNASSGSQDSGSVQTFTVTTTGVYTIDAYGASGGLGYSGGRIGGYGANAKGNFTLTAGTTLQIAVGKAGENEIAYGSNNALGQPGGVGSGGGGGTFVYSSTSTPLVVAGGGGGAVSWYNESQMGSGESSTVLTTSGTGTGGAATGSAGGGAGWNGDGQDSSGGGGKSINGSGNWNGGYGWNTPARGGYGGGGGNGSAGGGGGGGYIGGTGAYAKGVSYSTGKAGTSFIASNAVAGSSSNSTLATAGNGKVVITRVS